MGFGEYDPGLNRFLTRDLYDGALNDMALGSDPWNTNRYAFAGGNPVTGIEYDGHCAFDPETEAACGMEVERTLNSGSTPQPETDPEDSSTSTRVAKWMGGMGITQNVGEELFIKPAVETYEACKAAVQMENYATNWQQCQTGVALTALGFTGGGKIVGTGVRTLEGLAAARAEAATAGALLGRTAATKAAGNAPIVWPPNNGFNGILGPLGNPGVTVLRPGTLVDRFGYDGGRFVEPNGTPIGQQALAPGTTGHGHPVLLADIGRGSAEHRLPEEAQLMNSTELISELQRRRVPSDAYSIGSDRNEAYCLTGSEGEWHVYYSERGNGNADRLFTSEDAACEELLRRLLSDGAIRRWMEDQGLL